MTLAIAIIALFIFCIAVDVNRAMYALERIAKNTDIREETAIDQKITMVNGLGEKTDISL